MAIAEDKLPKGGDREFQGTLKDEATKTPIDLTSLAEIEMIVYYKSQNNDHTIQSYSLNDSSKELITIVDGPNGIFSILLQSKVTKQAQIGDLFGEIKTETADSSYDDNKKHDVVRDVILTQITRSLTADLL